MKANVSTQVEYNREVKAFVDVIIVSFGATRITLRGNANTDVPTCVIEGDDEQQTLEGSLHEVWPWLVDAVKGN